MVPLKDENLTPSKWNLGRVVNVYPGSHRLVRIVTIRTDNRLMRRAIPKLCVLPQCSF